MDMLMVTTPGWIISVVLYRSADYLHDDLPSKRAANGGALPGSQQRNSVHDGARPPQNVLKLKCMEASSVSSSVFCLL